MRSCAQAASSSSLWRRVGGVVGCGGSACRIARPTTTAAAVAASQVTRRCCSSSSSSTTVVTKTAAATAAAVTRHARFSLDTTVGIDAHTVARSLEQRNLVQRLLRRLPVGSSSTLLYLNELPSMVKTGLVRLAVMRRREQQQHQQQTPVSDNASTRALLRLRAPDASVSDAALASMAAAYRTQPLSPHAHTRHVASNDDNGDDDDEVVEAPIVLVPQTQEQHNSALGVCTYTSPLLSSSSATTGGGGVRARASATVTVTSASSALRVSYRVLPQVYILGLPVTLVQDAEHAYAQRSTHNNDNGDGSGSSSCCTESVVEQLLRRWLVYDGIAHQLLLRRRRRRRCHTQPSSPCTHDAHEHVFFAQTYAFSPHDALAAAAAVASPQGNNKQQNGNNSSSSNSADTTAACSYCLFFVVAAADDVSGTTVPSDGGSSSSNSSMAAAANTSTLPPLPTNASPQHASVALRDVGALYPSSFRTYAVELPTSTTMSTPWTPMSMKRLRYNNNNSSNNSSSFMTRSDGGSDGSSGSANLWSAQLSNAQIAYNSTTQTAMQGLRPDKRSSSSSDEEAHYTHTGMPPTSTSVLQEREWLQLAERSFAASRSALLQRSGHEDDTACTQHVCGSNNMCGHDKASATRHAAVTTPSAAHSSSLSCARVRHVRFTVAVATPTPPPPLPPSTTASLATQLHRAMYRYKHELRARLQQQLFAHSTSGTATQQQQQQQPPQHTPLLMTALDDIIVARERVLLPFLRQPRRHDVSLCDVTHVCRGGHAAALRAPKTTRAVATTATARGTTAAAAAMSFVPVLWQMGELEEVTGWRGYETWFMQRYGALRDVLASDLLVTVGDGAYNAYNSVGKIINNNSSSSGNVVGHGVLHMTEAPYPREPFVLLHDDVYVRRVLLPALRRYARHLHQSSRSRGGSSGRHAALSLCAHKACRRHAACLQGWLQTLCALDAEVQHAWLRLGSHHTGNTSTATAAAAAAAVRVPATLRPLLAAVLQRRQQETMKMKCVRFAAVPIVSFLEWATLPPCCRRRSCRRSSSSGGGNAKAYTTPALFSHADMVRFVQYALCYGAHMDVSAGDGTTVAFAVVVTAAPTTTHARDGSGKDGGDVC